MVGMGMPHGLSPNDGIDFQTVGIYSNNRACFKQILSINYITQCAEPGGRPVVKFSDKRAATGRAGGLPEFI
jgi:hypothetical protein